MPCVLYIPICPSDWHLITPCLVGGSPQRKASGANGKKGSRNSAGAMNLLATAAEDNEAYEHTLTHAQLQQLQQHLLQQQFQVISRHACMGHLRSNVLSLLPFCKQYTTQVIANAVQGCSYRWSSTWQ